MQLTAGYSVTTPLEWKHWRRPHRDRRHARRRTPEGPPGLRSQEARSPGDASAKLLAELFQRGVGAGVPRHRPACPEIGMSRLIQYAASARLCVPADRAAGALREIGRASCRE